MPIHLGKNTPRGAPGIRHGSLGLEYWEKGKSRRYYAIPISAGVGGVGTAR